MITLGEVLSLSTLRGATMGNTRGNIDFSVFLDRWNMYLWQLCIL